MSQEIFEIVSKMDMKNLELQLALQCAPVLTGIKISNLLIIENESIKNVKKLLKDTDISWKLLLKGKEKSTLLLYRKKYLIEYLQNEEVIKMLNNLGYKEITLYKIFPVFIKRYGEFMKNKIEFPHEMGLFLGYPLEDVVGFIDNKGKKSLYCGYWKVYKNKRKKINIFNKFDKARENLIKHTAKGIDIINFIESNNKLITI